MSPKFLFFVLVIVLVISLLGVRVSAATLPPGLQKIKEYNQQSTQEFAVKVSFLVAFVAGMLGILSPCILPFLPAYFSYTFKEKKNLTLMTGIFTLGFTVVFVILGVIAGMVGEQSLAIMQKRWITTIAGLFLLFMGWLVWQGKGLVSILPTGKKFSNDVPGVFLFGIFFALGWTACVGPILAGILGIGAVLGNYWQSGLLLVFYSLGNLVPLFLLSFLYDRFKLGEWSWIKGKRWSFTLGNRVVEVHSTNAIAAILFFIIGAGLIIFGSTAIVNTLDLLGTREYFYSLQRALLGWRYAPIVGIAGLLFIIVMLGHSWWKRNNNKTVNEPECKQS